jgi:hypothetical protein
MKIEIKKHPEENTNAIFVEGELFDWAVPEDAIQELELIHDKVRALRYYWSIKNHFIQCFSEFVGTKTTINQLLDGLQKGEI